MAGTYKPHVKHERSEKTSAESMFLEDLYKVQVLAHHKLNIYCLVFFFFYNKGEELTMSVSWDTKRSKCCVKKK